MRRRIAAFKHALSGGRTLLATQPHARFHAVAAVLVFTIATLLEVTPIEWALLILCVLSVWVTEAVNTAIEFLADEVSLERRERIKHAKDIAAFAVLSAAAGAAVVGSLILLPYLLNL